MRTKTGSHCHFKWDATTTKCFVWTVRMVWSNVSIRANLANMLSQVALHVSTIYIQNVTNKQESADIKILTFSMNLSRTTLSLLW